MKKKKIRSLKSRMIVMLLFGWLFPLLVIILGALHFVSSMLDLQVEKNVFVSMEKAIEICEIRLEDVTSASKNASYQQTVKRAYKNYQKDRDKGALHSAVTDFLNEQYKFDTRLYGAVIYFTDMPTEIYYTYNAYGEEEKEGDSARIKYFRENVKNQLISHSRSMGTQTQLYEKEGHLYLIRNLLENDYTTFGMVALELAPDQIFESLGSILGGVSYNVYLGDVPLLKHELQGDFDLSLLNQPTDGIKYMNETEYAYAYMVREEKGHKLAYLSELNAKEVVDNLYMVRYVFLLVLLIVLPLIIVVIRFFYQKVSRPVARLVEAASEISMGKFGLEIEEVSDSVEFASLENAFNTMSKQLKRQFEKIYLEEIALKDANIKALQSQINPHFFNNTLENINWEARMSGNKKVGEMISALSTMLNATINREQQHFVPLSEELGYVDAFLYIIGCRYGDGLTVVRHIDKDLMDVEIPRLIIQPIVENAIEHGVAKTRRGRVVINIYQKREKMYIEVINEGKLSKEDRENIGHLLNDEVLEKEVKRTSLGVRNVNKRLKIIYGESCGLKIRSRGDRTVSTLVINIEIPGGEGAFE
jgi:Predicted signal transduction protein with a C-terminal ATPase domain